MNKQGKGYWLTLLLTGCLVLVPGVYGQAFVNGSRTQHGPTNYCADAGSTDAYACALSPAISAYAVGNSYRFKANTANTGAATVDFGPGAVAIKTPAGSDLATGDIRANQMVDVVYTAGSVMQMQSAAGNNALSNGIVIGSNIEIDPMSTPYNATGDGVADDTTAVQAAITAAAAAKVPVVIRKTFAVSGLSLPTNSFLQGYPGGILKHNGVGSTSLVTIAASATNVTISVELQGAATDETTQTSGVTIAAAGISNIKITNSSIHDFNQLIAINGASSNTATEITVENSVFADAIGTTAGYGYGIVISGTGSSSITIRSNTFSTIGRTALYFGSGSSKVRAEDNDIYHSTGASDAVTSWSGLSGGAYTTDIIFENNRIYQPYATAMQFNGGTNGLIVRDNKIYDPQNAGYCVILDTGAAASAGTGKNVVVSGNYCRTAQAQPGYLVKDFLNTVLDGNVNVGTSAQVAGFLVADSASNLSRNLVLSNNVSIGDGSTRPDRVVSIQANGANPKLINNSGNFGYTPVVDLSGGVGSPVMLPGQSVAPYTDGATTPSLALCGAVCYMRVANTAPTSITNFTDATDGQLLILLFADGNTTITRANALLDGGASFVSANSQTLMLVYYGGYWYQIGKSTVNS